MPGKSLPQTIHSIIAVNHFSLWLADNMAKNHVSEREVAEAIGVERKTICAFLRKQRYPKLDIVVALYDYFGENYINIPIKSFDFEKEELEFHG